MDLCIAFEVVYLQFQDLENENFVAAKKSCVLEGVVIALLSTSTDTDTASARKIGIQNPQLKSVTGYRFVDMEMLGELFTQIQNVHALS